MHAVKANDNNNDGYNSHRLHLDIERNDAPMLVRITVLKRWRIVIYALKLLAMCR